MKANVTKQQLCEQLVKVFASAADLAVYNSDHEQYQGLCGWCGVMAPLSRPAYIKEFGAASVMEAETAARAELAARRKEYAASEWAKYKDQADRHKTDEQREAICQLVGRDWSRIWISPEGLALEMFDKLDLYTPKISPKTAKADAGTHREASADEQHTQAPSGTLKAEKYSERATVVRGYTNEQYKDLTSMGGKYNRRLQGGSGIIFSTKKHGAAIAEYIARHTAY